MPFPFSDAGFEEENPGVTRLGFPMKKTLCLILVILLAQSLGVSQNYRPQGNFVFNADFARFRYDSTSSYVEIYYGLYPRLLSYNKVDSIYNGMVVIHTLIHSKDSDSAVVNQHFLIPVTVPDTTFRNVNATFVTQSTYALPFGDYVLEVSAHDSLQPFMRDSVSYALSLHPFSGPATSSDLELCSDVESSTHKSKMFEKNSLDVVPNPSLVFGATTHPVSFYYLELYNLTPGSSYTIKERLLDGSNKVVRESAKHQKYDASNVVDVGMMNVSSFPSGRYSMDVSVYNEGGTQLLAAKKVLFLSNPHIKQPVVNATALNSNEFAGMTDDELSEEFREAQYIASSDEKAQFKKLTTLEAKREFLARFWSAAEKQSADNKAKIRSIYLHRVGVADQRYRGLGKKGWQTDRGRVYILYGEPDEIERFPNTGNSKPYEIWHYYQIESGVEFDFIDRNGFGNYILVNSTKRGEIQDSQWQNYLR